MAKSQKTETPIINILTYGLPFDLANQMYNEYQNRLAEVKYILEISDYYKSLKVDFEVVELILALSIFYKRVVCNLKAAVKFHNTVYKFSSADIIQIGKYNFNNQEKNSLLSLILNFNELTTKYGITGYYFDYFETKELLKKVRELKNSFENGETNKNDNSNYTNEFDPDTLPF
ncbi:hypothetical protein [Sediminibacterium sp.]|uniref:hypothetical protein n=1 Tax=Sediminibacterium sp. TaxID=1917865 RepID=UPI003F728D0C